MELADWRTKQDGHPYGLWHRLPTLPDRPCKYRIWRGAWHIHDTNGTDRNKSVAGDSAGSDIRTTPRHGASDRAWLTHSNGVWDRSAPPDTVHPELQHHHYP